MSIVARNNSHWRKRMSRFGLTGYLFASPWLVGFFLLVAFPMAASLLLSFTEWNGISLSQIRWVGLENYTNALRLDERGDDLVYTALWNTLVYSFVSVPLGLMVALMLAVLLNQSLRGIALFRTVFYMPHVIGGIATIMMWLFVFNPDVGLLNIVIRPFYDALAAVGVLREGASPPAWIYDSAWSKPSLILMAVWGVGGAMLIFLAGLQNVPDQLYEAADIDGAGLWGKFRNVTLPQLTPTIFFNLVMGVIGSFQVFNEAYIMTGGGPDNSTLFFVLYLYRQAFEQFNLGYASALAWILFVIILAFTLVILRSSKVWVYYEGDPA
ncbi:MAG: sugar ABC transporter permease [Phycisphaerales bacterium]